MIKWRRDEKGLKILHFHLYGHFKSTWQVAKCCCKEIRHQQMTNPYDVYEKSTYRKVSQMRGWDSGGDFAVSFGCESCFSSETQSFCVAQSKSVPNMVVIMRIFRKKWLRSSIGRSQGVRIPASLSEWGGEPVYPWCALNRSWTVIATQLENTNLIDKRRGGAHEKYSPT